MPVVRPGSSDALAGSGDDLETSDTRGVSLLSFEKSDEPDWTVSGLKA